MAIGWAAGPEGLAPIKGLFYDLFKGALALFLMEMGLIVSRQIGRVAPARCIHGRIWLVDAVVVGAHGVGMRLALGSDRLAV